MNYIVEFVCSVLKSTIVAVVVSIVMVCATFYWFGIKAGSKEVDHQASKTEYNFHYDDLCKRVWAMERFMKVKYVESNGVPEYKGKQ